MAGLKYLKLQIDEHVVFPMRKVNSTKYVNEEPFPIHAVRWLGCPCSVAMLRSIFFGIHSTELKLWHLARDLSACFVSRLNHRQP
jgi:hypothetical protein